MLINTIEFNEHGGTMEFFNTGLWTTGKLGPRFNDHRDPNAEWYKMHPVVFPYVALIDDIYDYRFDLYAGPSYLDRSANVVSESRLDDITVEDWRGNRILLRRGIAHYDMPDLAPSMYPIKGQTYHMSARLFGTKDFDGDGVIEGLDGECVYIIKEIGQVSTDKDSVHYAKPGGFSVSSKGGRFSFVDYVFPEPVGDSSDNFIVAQPEYSEYTFAPVTERTVTDYQGKQFVQTPYDGGTDFIWTPETEIVRLKRGEDMTYVYQTVRLHNYDMEQRYRVEIDYPDGMSSRMKVKNGFWSSTSEMEMGNDGYFVGYSELTFIQFLTPLENGIYPVSYRIYAENGDSYERTITYVITDDGEQDMFTDFPSKVNRGQSYEVKVTSPSNPNFTLPEGMQLKEIYDRTVKIGDQYWENTYTLTVEEDAPLGLCTVTTSAYDCESVTDTIEVLGSTELIVEAPDEVEEETEYTVDVFFYQDGRDIEVTVPEGVNIWQEDAWFDYPTMRALHEYTLLVDEDYEEASFTLTVSDGHTTFSKEINVTEKEIIMPTITFSPSALDFVQAGETKTLTVTYTDTTTEFINRPYSSDLGVTIHETSLTQNGTNVVGTYAVTVESTIYATTIPLIFSCSSPQGASSTATLLATQQGGSPDTGETRGWITLDKYIAYVPADGGEVFVKAQFGYPVGKEVLSCRVRNANGVYPIAWCRGVLTGGEAEDDGTVGTEDWKFVFTANTATESRTAVCVFSYTNFYGEKGSATLTIVQDAGDGEDVTQEPSEIVPYVSLIKMTAEGENYYGGSTDYFNVNYFKIAERNAPSVNVDWFRITDSQVISEGQFDTLVRYWYECDANSLTNPRNAEITLSGTDEYGETVTAKVSVQQARHTAPEDGEEGEGQPSEPGVYIGQIWKDVVYTFGNLEKASYSIWKGNTMIFKGISWLRPSTGVNSILVNRICQNYLGVPELKKGSVGTIVGYDTFTLRNGEGTITYATYKFVNAWNYNDEFRTGLLSYPILDRPFVVRGQMTPFSVFGAGEEVKVAFGVTYRNYVDDFDNVTEGWGSTDYVNDSIYHDYFTVTSREKDYISSVYIGNREYQVEEPCRIRYVLYYLNPWGGLDWFPITGNYRMTDNITQYTYTRNYNNTTLEFGKSRYLAEIERKYTLTTGWLKQSESDRMWYLLESNLVYLHDLQEDKVIPVTIDDTTLEHKRKDRMNKIIQYTFTVTESQLRERI